MDNSQLTVSDLVRKNMKNRGAEYRSLIIGVVMAISFISFMVILIFSIIHSHQTKFYAENSTADLYIFETSTSELDNLVSTGDVESYGLSTSYAYYLDSGLRNFSVASLDETSLNLLDFEFIEGRAPETDGEIVLEESAWSRLANEAEVGDTIFIPLNFYDNSGERITIEPIEYEFTLVGITVDKNVNIKETSQFMVVEFTQDFPFAYVSEFTDIPDGAVPSTSAYVKLTNFADNRYGSMDSFRLYQSYNAYYVGYRPFSEYLYSSDMVNITTSAALIVLALLTASVLAISNSLTAVLDSRQRQIALMRAIGASKSQLFSIYARETFVISLIALPLGLLLGTALVYLVTVNGPDYLFLSIDIWAILILAILSMLVVFMASLLPLRRAVNIPPMQAIRNVDMTRKLRKTELNSRTRYNPVKLIAKRNIRISNKSYIGISIFVALSLAFAVYITDSVIFQIRNNNRIEHDFELNVGSSNDRFTLYYELDKPRLNENDLATMSNLPQVSEIDVISRIELTVPIEEIPEYFTIGYRAMAYEEAGNYALAKEAFGYQDEFLHLDLFVLEEDRFEDFSEHIVDGEINYEEINSGEEVIVLFNTMVKTTYGSGGYGTGYKANPHNDYLEADSYEFFEQDYFKAGDLIEMNFHFTENSYPVGFDYDQESQAWPDKSEITKLRNTPKIQAVINVEQVASVSELVPENGIYTTTEGLRNMNLPLFIDRIDLTLEEEVSENLEDYVHSELDVIQSRYPDSYIQLLNLIEFETASFESFMQLILTMFMVITIALGICISIVNNNISARIKSSQRVIGTMRAVGMDKGQIKRSYNLQILYYFLFGSIFGIIAGVVYSRYSFSGTFLMDEFSIVPTIVALAFMFIMIMISYLNVNMRLDKILDKDIVDNIRTL